MYQQECNILIIGSGIAGLSFALYCAEFFPKHQITVLSKGPLAENNTRYAQGGIAAVMDRLRDSYQNHIDDTLQAGDGFCDPKIVELVVKEAPRAMLKLMDWGVNFDRKDEQLSLGREGGHSADRILHIKDHTGLSIGESLLKKAQNTPNIELRENQFVRQLICSRGQCLGAEVMTTNATYLIKSDYTLLATGGAGQVYQLSSNPTIATGDGIALAKSAGAHLKGMAFVQFHPTVLYDPNTEKPFLISEAVRGYGAILRNNQGEDFMFNYDSRGALATRDIVARAIFSEMQKSGDPHLWLDLRHLDKVDFERSFPTIAQRVRDLGINVAKEMIPVLPAAHYFCGGVKTDECGLTDIDRLFAVGECANTGLHGANRLASNSLLEALVFAQQAARYLSENYVAHSKSADLQNFQSDGSTETEFRSRIQEIMTNKAGIIRSKEGLQEAHEQIVELLSQLPDFPSAKNVIEDRNLALVALSVIEDSLQQTENRGGFFREDFS